MLVDGSTYIDLERSIRKNWTPVGLKKHRRENKKVERKDPRGLKYRIWK